MSNGSWVKDPEEILDYQFNFAPWLDTTNGETIASHEIDIDAGINLDSHPATGQTVTVWLSGGTINNKYNVTCEATTSAARTVVRSITIVVENR
jgi:hypothetical protein